MTTFFLKIDGETDKDGNTPHTLTWFDPDFHTGPRNRGQCFLSNIDRHIKRLEEEGHKVVKAT